MDSQVRHVGQLALEGHNKVVGLLFDCISVNHDSFHALSLSLSLFLIS